MILQPSFCLAYPLPFPFKTQQKENKQMSDDPE